jgi:two-component system alkaline phosphatase synthesis response regulator PhoP
MTKKTQVLVVDDDDKIRSIIEAILIPRGHQVLLASGGEEALNILATTNPDLILLDIFMPKQDGYSTLAKIKGNESTKEIPVVMVSGVGQDLNKKLANQMGANGYITKPFKAYEILEAVDQYIKRG